MHTCHVGKARHEADDVDTIRCRAVQPHNLVFGDVRERRDVGEVRSEVPSVTDSSRQGAGVARAVERRASAGASSSTVASHERRNRW